VKGSPSKVGGGVACCGEYSLEFTGARSHKRSLLEKGTGNFSKEEDQGEENCYPEGGGGSSSSAKARCENRGQSARAAKGRAGDSGEYEMSPKGVPGSEEKKETEVLFLEERH